MRSALRRSPCRRRESHHLHPADAGELEPEETRSNERSGHQQKPDVDNMIKALMDALYAEDAHIWDLRVTKLWGESGQILISDNDSAGDNNNA
jgi:hypothetical protein